MKQSSAISVTSSQVAPLIKENIIYVFGHCNPDSDSICSSLVTADWLNYTGRPAKSFRLGELTPETKYILKVAGVTQPDLLTENLSDKKVWLVDFTDMEQGPPSLSLSDIIGIIDHHRLGTVITKNPPDVWIRAVGCTATVILSIITIESPMVLSSTQAILLLGAILSDTVVLSSPTTTEQDRVAVSRLTKLANIDYEQFIAQLIAAKTDISDFSAAQLLMRDAKNYQLCGLALLIAQIEVIDMDEISSMIPSLQKEIEQKKQQSKLDMVILMVTDITHHNSILYFSDNTIIGRSQVLLPGIMSRKKELLPWLTARLTLREK